MCDFIDAQTTAVNSYNKLRSAFRQSFYCFATKTIAIIKPTRYKCTYMQTKLSKCIEQKCCCTQSIDVVVTVYNDIFFFGFSSFKSCNSLFHTWQQKRICQFFIVRMQKSLTLSFSF